MDKSIDALITNTFERRIREADRIAREFKAPQVTSGASGLLAYEVENPVTWDATVTLPAVPVGAPGSEFYDFDVTFTGDGSQGYPIAELIAEITVNGHALYPEQGGYWVYADSPTWPYTIRFSSSIYALDYEPFFTDKYRIRWSYGFFYNSNNPVTVRVKLRARSTSPGVLSMVRTK